MDRSSVRAYISKNWYKLLLALILVFIILKKDLSFQIRLNAPVKREQPTTPRKQLPAEEQATPSGKELLSENEEKAPLARNQPPEIEQFDLSKIGRERKRRNSSSERLPPLEEAAVKSFIERFDHVAVNEREKFGIPSSLILANGLLISRAGQRDMARRGFNFFALPCTSDWKGPEGTYQGNCFRHYKNAWTSFRDHSLFLSSGKLAALRRFEDDDYKAWARELEEEGFYEAPGMALEVIRIIEKWQLYKLDR